MTNAQWSECLKLSRLMVELRAIQKQIDETEKSEELLYAHFLLQKKRKSAQIRYWLSTLGYRAPRDMPWVRFTDIEVCNFFANKESEQAKRESREAYDWHFPGRKSLLQES